MKSISQASTKINSLLVIQNHPTARNSRVELLRIIAMLLIILHHFSLHGILGEKEELFTNNVSFNFIFLEIQRIVGKIGVDIFIIISAWYMVDKKFRYNKLIKLFGEVWFYSIGILLLFLFVLSPVKKIEVDQIINSCLPILTGLIGLLQHILF